MKKLFLILSMVFLFCVPTFAFPVKVKDDSGYVLSIPKIPQRIISTIPSNTEILFSLDLSKRIIAVSDKCNYPGGVARKERIGSLPLNVEKIVSLNPDLVVMLGDAQKEDILRLRNLGLPVFVINPHNCDDVMESILLLGKATGKDSKARQLVSEMKKRMSRILEETRERISFTPPKIFAEVWSNPLTSAGDDTVIGDIIKLSGGINIAASLKGEYPQFSIEKLVQQDPDVIIVPVISEGDINMLKQDKRFQGLRAVKQNRVLYIDADLISRPGPRLVDALEILVSYLYGKK